ncbi:MAG: hypothetical protein Q8K82_12735 [Gemmatimonadaceae bacterium]|nr:hypothetical protein [Gemmatimonadaceae bacterium]
MNNMSMIVAKAAPALLARARRTAGSLLTLSAFLLGACSTDNLLSVDTPDIVTPDNLAGGAGLAVLRAGAFGDLALAVGGAAAGHGSTPGLVHYVSSFTDEVTYSGTFPTRRQFDERRVQDDIGDVNNLFRNIHRARASAEFAAATVEKASSTDPRRSELLSLAGFAYVFLGENFCSGVPISTATQSGDLEYGEPLTTQKIFEQAVGIFDRALTGTSTTSPERNLASVGKGRALLNLGRFPEAAQALAAVPTSFRLDLEFSTNSTRQQNGVYALSGVDRQYSVSERESPNGMPFRSLGDPRVVWARTEGEVGQDGATAFFLQKMYDTPSAPFRLATGTEARLIEAEAALRANDVTKFAGIHMALRASINLPAVDVVPMSAEQRVDFHFRERALWLWLSAHRLSDMRRLVRQYARSATSVFPSGPYFKGGTYGTDVNFPLPVSELNNPKFKGCLDRLP